MHVKQSLLSNYILDDRMNYFFDNVNLAISGVLTSYTTLTVFQNLVNQGREN